MSKNRKQRRADKRQNRRYMAPGEMERLARNASHAAACFNVDVTYSAFLLCAHEVFGFGHIRAQRLLDAVNEKVALVTNTHDMREEVKKILEIDLVDVREEISLL